MPSPRPKPSIDWFVPRRDVATQQRLIRPLLMLELTGFESADLERLAAKPLEPGQICVTLRSAWQARLAAETLEWRAGRRAQYRSGESEPRREVVMIRAVEIGHPDFMSALGTAVTPAANVTAELTRIARITEEHLRASRGAVGIAHAMQALADAPGWADPITGGEVAVALALAGIVTSDGAIRVRASDEQRTAAGYARRMLLGYGRDDQAPICDDIGTPMEYRAHHVAVALLGAALAWREWTECGWGLEQLVPWFRGIACRECLGRFVEMLE